MRCPEPHSLVAALLLSGCTCAGSLPGRKAVRPPEMAGDYYERDPLKLPALLDALLSAAEVEPGPVQAILVPHAAHDWSGAVAGRTFGALRGKRYRRIVLVAENHDPGYAGAALPAEGGFQTPLGALAIDEPAVALLERYPGFARRAVAYDHEYSLEVQLPFVQRLWPEAKLVTVMIGQADEGDLAEIGEALRNVLDEDTLLVASTTMTHFGAARGYTPFALGPDKAGVEAALRAFEKPFVEAMTRRSPARLLALWHETGTTACGLRAALVALQALGDGVEGQVAAYGSTLDTEFDPDDPAGISYLGLLFPGRFPTVPALGERDEHTLGRLAWDAVAAAVAGRSFEAPGELPPRLQQPGGAFVTIYLHGQLKGCMGRLEAPSLAEAVVEAGQMAAGRDPRFAALRPEQLGQCELEVSALGPFLPCAGGDDFEPGRHGLLLTHGYHRGLLLPQVATRHRMGREAFLEALADKAGMGAGGWQTAKLLRFGVAAFAPRRAGTPEVA